MFFTYILSQISFFLHTCFSDYDVIKNFPYLKSIIKGIVSADHIGVHTHEYKKAIYDSIQNKEFNTRELLIITRNLSFDNKFNTTIKEIDKRTVEPLKKNN